MGVLIIGLSFLVVFWNLRLWMSLYVVCGWSRRISVGIISFAETCSAEVRPVRLADARSG